MGCCPALFLASCTGPARQHMRPLPGRAAVIGTGSSNAFCAAAMAEGVLCAHQAAAVAVRKTGRCNAYWDPWQTSATEGLSCPDGCWDSCAVLVSLAAQVLRQCSRQHGDQWSAGSCSSCRAGTCSSRGGSCASRQCSGQCSRCCPRAAHQQARRDRGSGAAGEGQKPQGCRPSCSRDPQGGQLSAACSGIESGCSHVPRVAEHDVSSYLASRDLPGLVEILNVGSCPQPVQALSRCFCRFSCSSPSEAQPILSIAASLLNSPSSSNLKAFDLHLLCQMERGNKSSKPGFRWLAWLQARFMHGKCSWQWRGSSKKLSLFACCRLSRPRSVPLSSSWPGLQLLRGLQPPMRPPTLLRRL